MAGRRKQGSKEAGARDGKLSDGGTERRKQIAEAALRVFAGEGFEKATIKKIAAEAGIKSSALIYWYFDNKAELLEAALVEGLGRWRGRLILDPDISPRIVLEEVADAFMEMLSQDRVGQVMKIGLSQLLRRPDILDRFARHGPLRIIGSLEDYLRAQMERGRLRAHDPATVARLFFFGLLGYALHHEVAESLRHSLPSAKLYVSSMLDVLLGGIDVATGSKDPDATGFAGKERGEGGSLV